MTECVQHCRRRRGRDAQGQIQFVWVEGQRSHSHLSKTRVPSGKQFISKNSNQCVHPPNFTVLDMTECVQHCRRRRGRDAQGQIQFVWVEGQRSHSHLSKTRVPSGKQFISKNSNQCVHPPNFTVLDMTECVQHCRRRHTPRATSGGGEQRDNRPCPPTQECCSSLARDKRCTKRTHASAHPRKYQPATLHFRVDGSFVPLPEP